jgi:hypothetical protein
MDISDRKATKEWTGFGETGLQRKWRQNFSS